MGNNNNKQMEQYSIYTDGGSRGNPGPSGAGGVIIDPTGTVVAEISEYIGCRTNNQAEYESLILTLQRAVQMGIKHVKCFMDSSLVVNQVNKRWKINNEILIELCEQVNAVIVNFDSFRLSHVFRDSNKHADQLANKAMDSVVSE
jgi:ribonuclease HI